MESSSRRVTDAVWPWRRAEERRARERAERRRHARRAGAVQAVVGWLAALLLFRFVSPLAAALVASIAAVLLLLALFSPLGAHARVTRWVGRFAYGVGLTLTWLLMPILFFLVFLPLGLVLRSSGRLRLERDPRPDRSSYWRPAGSWPKPQGDYRRQF